MAALSNVVSERTRTNAFAWYALTGSFATALGSLSAGDIVHVLQKSAMAPLNSYRMIIILYAVLGAPMVFFFNRLTSAAEVISHDESDISRHLPKCFGIGHSHGVVMKLSGPFALVRRETSKTTNSLSASGPARQHLFVRRITRRIA